MGALEGYGIVPDGYRIGNDTFGAENAIYTITVFSDGVTFSQGETHIAFNNDGTVTVERGQTANNGRSGTTYLVPRVMSR